MIVGALQLPSPGTNLRPPPDLGVSTRSPLEAVASFAEPSRSAAQMDRCFSSSSALFPMAYSSRDLYNRDPFIPGTLLHHTHLLIRSLQL
ncbi:UNVERIFIED_CONTAM: hypothetical protein FKN15_001816 [Acipenser sinensis]